MKVSKSKHPRYPWRLIWNEGTKRRNKFFATEKEADDYKRLIKGRLTHVAPSDIPPTAEERRALHEARLHDVPLMEAVTHWRATAGASRGRSVSDLIDARLFDLMNSKVTPHYERWNIRELERAREEFGSAPAISLTPEQCQRFVASSGGYYSQELTRAILGSVFSHAVAMRWLQFNPAANIKLPERDKKTAVEIFTVEEASDWLCCVAAHAPSCLAGWAIALFAGLRVAEITRLHWNEVKLSRGHIEVTAAKSKTRTRRLVDIQPNLTEILEPLAGEGSILPHSPRRAVEVARQAYGQRVPRNVARHSFVSYHLALFSDLNLTEMQAGHDKAVLFQHYRELVTKDDAEVYFSITVS